MSKAEDGYLIERFLEMLVAERGASPHTVENYRRDLLHFCAEKRIKSLMDVTPEAIEKYLASLHKEAYSPKTIARRLSALRQCFRFLEEEKLRSDNPTVTLETPKQPKSLPKMLSGEEIAQLLAGLEDSEQPEAIRL